ncbi:MAG: phage major capsid protein [Verrucomicrobiota bacterium]
MNPIKRLNEKRGNLLRESQTLLDQAVRENRQIKPAEDLRLLEIRNQIFDIDADLAREQLNLQAAGRADLAGRGSMPDLRGYSLVRAINEAGSGRLSGLELECSEEIEHRSGTKANGFFIPNQILVEKRGLAVTTSSGADGGLAVGTITEGLLEALRPASKVIAAGATIFSGLSSNIAIPRQSAASTASWHSELGELDDVSGTIDQITLQPNRVGSFVELSNQLLVQVNPSIEGFIQNDLIQAIATAIDAAAINGTGANNQPLGILHTPNIGSVVGGTDGAAPSWSHICQLVEKVADANADFGSLAYLTNSKVAAKLRSSAKVTGTDSRMILEGNTLLDYPVLFSNNVPSGLTKGLANAVCSAIIFGNWADVLIGQFGLGTDLIVDRFTKATGGVTRVIAQSFVDIAVRREASFAAMLDVLTA